jgi:hypothetical protein
MALIPSEVSVDTLTLLPRAGPNGQWPTRFGAEDEVQTPLRSEGDLRE